MLFLDPKRNCRRRLVANIRQIRDGRGAMLRIVVGTPHLHTDRIGSVIRHILIEGAKTKNRSQISRYREIENRHTAIQFVTPQDRHMGKDRAILADRKKVYEAAQNGIHNAGQAKPETGNASRSSR